MAKSEGAAAAAPAPAIAVTEQMEMKKWPLFRSRVRHRSGLLDMVPDDTKRSQGRIEGAHLLLGSLLGLLLYGTQQEQGGKTEA